MNIKDRTKYTQTVLAVYLRFFIIVFGMTLLGIIVNIVRDLITGGSISSALWLLLRGMLASVGAGLVGGWVMAAILGGALLVIAYFERKKIALNIFTALLLLILTVPIGIFAAVPFAIYSAIKYKIPLEIKFEKRKHRKRKKRKPKK
ncbi:MAG: hypothetical protein FWE28_08630 [Oscillospiraceae bacterium]|nr:hypothetical protein [Oscillospiraceae bacterium]